MFVVVELRSDVITLTSVGPTNSFYMDKDKAPVFVLPVLLLNKTYMDPTILHHVVQCSTVRYSITALELDGSEF